jgi:hypothetical protein
MKSYFVSQGVKLDFAFSPENILSQAWYKAEFLAKLSRAKPAEGFLLTKLCRRACSDRLSGQVTLCHSHVQKRPNTLFQNLNSINADASDTNYDSTRTHGFYGGAMDHWSSVGLTSCAAWYEVTDISSVKSSLQPTLLQNFYTQHPKSVHNSCLTQMAHKFTIKTNTTQHGGSNH